MEIDTFPHSITSNRVWRPRVISVAGRKGEGVGVSMEGVVVEVWGGRVDLDEDGDGDENGDGDGDGDGDEDGKGES